MSAWGVWTEDLLSGEIGTLATLVSGALTIVPIPAKWSYSLRIQLVITIVFSCHWSS
jgi:hypothetical protein